MTPASIGTTNDLTHQAYELHTANSDESCQGIEMEPDSWQTIFEYGRDILAIFGAFCLALIVGYSVLWATNKAMSAAYKYAAFQMFAIPTEGDNDADYQTHQVAPRAAIKHSPTGGMFDLLEPDRKAVISDCADSMRERYAADDLMGAYEIAIHITDSEEKTALWDLLKPDSKLRAAIKKHSESLKPQKAAA